MLLPWHYLGLVQKWQQVQGVWTDWKSLQNEISKNGEEVFIQKLDVTIKSECDAFADAVLKKWGTIDILINNAGLQPLSFFKNLKVEEWDKMIDVNIRGVFYCTLQ